MNDDQFSVIRYSALRDTLSALLGVLVILWLALRSWKIIAAVFFSLMVGLAATAALGLAAVGSFNLISIAFFVLFVGLGVDFGIQFSVRYRAERHECDDVRTALRNAARKAGDPLALAAAATAVGFFSFLPTSYSGLSELGLIAGFGMLIAFACSITLVPAMIATLNPAGETEPVGFKSLAPLDHFLQRHRIAVIAVTVLAVLAGTPLLWHLPFDFNPVNLQNPDSPSVVTYRRMQRNPQTSGNDAEILASSLNDADSKAKTLASVPEVSSALTLSSFIPADQDQKIASIKAASQGLARALNPAQRQPAATDPERIAAIRTAADDLSEVAGHATGEGADAARRVSGLLKRLAGRRCRDPRQGGSSRGAAAEVRPRSARQEPQPVAGDHQDPAAQFGPRLDAARWQGAGSGVAKGRPKRQQCAEKLRDRGSARRTVGDGSCDQLL